MKVKIIGNTSFAGVWYANKIGQIIEVEEHNIEANSAKYRYVKNRNCFIEKSDCEIILEGETTFENAKVGDRVWSIRHGWGKIDTTNCQGQWKISVTFDNERMESYTLDGKEFDYDINPTLFWNEIKFDVPTRPKRKVKVPRIRYENIYSNYSETFSSEENARASVSKDPIAVAVELKGEYEVEE